MLYEFNVTKTPCSTDTIGYSPIKRSIEMPPKVWYSSIKYKILDKSNMKIPGIKYTPNLILFIKSPIKIIQS